MKSLWIVSPCWEQKPWEAKMKETFVRMQITFGSQLTQVFSVFPITCSSTSVQFLIFSHGNWAGNSILSSIISILLSSIWDEIKFWQTCHIITHFQALLALLGFFLLLKAPSRQKIQNKYISSFTATNKHVLLSLGISTFVEKSAWYQVVHTWANTLNLSWNWIESGV